MFIVSSRLTGTILYDLCYENRSISIFFNEYMMMMMS